jgi:hypothetical protein
MLCYPPDTDWGCADETFLADLPADVKARSEALAWSTLQALTAYQLSICPILVRPCRSGCIPGTWVIAPVEGGGPFFPGINNQGYWVNSCGCGGDNCGCGPLSEIILPGPIGGIFSIEIDGVEVDQGAYRVDNFNRLVAMGDLVWPICQDMSEPSDGTDSFSIVYYRGAMPDQLTKYAAGVLAYEFAKACTGGKCRLPAGVTSITRQGVTMDIPSGMWNNGITGIREVDAIVYLYNPNALKGPPVIGSPDIRRARQQTWSRA